MNRKLVVTFPGDRGTEIPLLYYGSKHYGDKGYEKLFINHPSSGEYDFESLFNNAKAVMEKMDLNEYGDMVFIAKSIGTVVACKIKDELNMSASLVLFTPVEETLTYINKNNNVILIAAGDKDRYLDCNKLVDQCETEGIPYHIEENIGHRMEVMYDLRRNLAVIENVIGKL